MPKILKITDKNLFHYDYYLSNVMNQRTNNTLFKDRSEAFIEAYKAFQKLPKIIHNTENEKKKTTIERAIKIQNWIDKYLSKEDRTRCLAAIRQRKFVVKRQPKIVKLSRDTFYDLQYCSEKVGLTYDVLISKLVEKELKRLRDKN